MYEAFLFSQLFRIFQKQHDGRVVKALDKSSDVRESSSPTRPNFYFLPLIKMGNHMWNFDKVWNINYT